MGLDAQNLRETAYKVGRSQWGYSYHRSQSRDGLENTSLNILF